ncbi:hypothetical protein EDD86DRAFT_200423 [Gorgonomyces haynaldii]|nr:hypothetical protein EDD86DRAFT_200423 [Gorgonomyces haynaldii]
MHRKAVVLLAQVIDVIVGFIHYILMKLFSVLLPFSPVWKERKVHDPIRTNFILVTGAGSGLGKETAFALARKGYSVFCAVRKSQQMQELQAKAEELGISDRVNPVLMDVSQYDSVTDGFDRIRARLVEVTGKLVGVVNNAGIGVPLRSLVEVSESSFDEIMSTNVKGAFLVNQEALKFMSRKCRIVLIGSVNGFLALPGTGLYSMSRFAMEAYADTLRRELSGVDVSVSLVQLGFTDSRANVWIREDPQKDHLTAAYHTTIAKVIQSDMKMPKSAVANVILGIFQSGFPKSRYHVGLDTKLFALLHFLPDPVFDFIMELIVYLVKDLKSPTL